MKVKFILKDNVYIIGYQSYPEPLEVAENEIIIDNPAEDLLQNYLWYKIVKGKPVKMDEKEFYEVHPECIIQEVEPTPVEILGQMATDAELERIELGQRMTDLELALMMQEGGEGNV